MKFNSFINDRFFEKCVATMTELMPDVKALGAEFTKVSSCIMPAMQYISELTHRHGDIYQIFREMHANTF
jgi:hypothetical protein